MSIERINLDDRTFDQLVEAAVAKVRERSANWNDLSVNDPGRILIEAFAYLTENMIYRLNRLPEKVFVELVRLLGVHVNPPSSASVTLQFTRPAADGHELVIPAGTRVATARSSDDDAPVFVTAADIAIPPQQTDGSGIALHCTCVNGELVSISDGRAGMSLQLQHAPLVAPTGLELDLVVGVETAADALDAESTAREFEGKTFRIWQEVDNFADADAAAYPYVVDRALGKIFFAPVIASDRLEIDAPQAIAEIPESGKEIRVWYRIGGGLAGNLAAHTLTQLKDAVPGVRLEVTNPQAAAGGRDIEPLEQTLMRAPIELHSLQRAVTARDFELVAVKGDGGVARAKAYTKATHWAHAPAGSIQLVLVPNLGSDVAGAVTHEVLLARQSDRVLEHVRDEIDRRKPLGTQCDPEWCKYKPVGVDVRVRVSVEENNDAVRERIITRLNKALSPAAAALTGADPRWPFGQTLSSYHVYKILSEEPGVEDVEPVVLNVDSVPDGEISSLSRDAYQPDTWFCADREGIYRSLNNGQGWELLQDFGGRVDLVTAFSVESGIRPHPGFVAALVTDAANAGASALFVSDDCGETWREQAKMDQKINDLAWMERDGRLYLWLAGENGLFETGVQAEDMPIQVLVDESDQDLGFTAVAVSVDVFGSVSVAAIARKQRGVFLSVDTGKPGSFRNIGLEQKLLSGLTVQHQGPRRYLWCMFDAVGDDPGKGCARWELRDTTDAVAGWVEFDKDWDAGRCLGLAFDGEGQVYAATSRSGVAFRSVDPEGAGWLVSTAQSGLPFREMDVGGKKFAMRPILCIGIGGARDGPSRVMVGGENGVYASDTAVASFDWLSSREFKDQVTIPFNWLFSSSEHRVEVYS
ncbi:MAG: baseplate J/gp47 family protein [Pseudomonadota bacterium]